MKKFLTVLLVIAVMFTFSFGSAFAAQTQTDEVKAAAVANDLKMATQLLDSLTAAFEAQAKLDGTYADAAIEYAVKAAKELGLLFINNYSAALAAEDADYTDNLVSAELQAWMGVSGSVSVAGSGAYAFTGTSFADKYAEFAAAKDFEALKKEALALIAAVNPADYYVDADDESINYAETAKTYKEAAEAAIKAIEATGNTVAKIYQATKQDWFSNKDYKDAINIYLYGCDATGTTVYTKATATATVLDAAFPGLYAKLDDLLTIAEKEAADKTDAENAGFTKTEMATIAKVTFYKANRVTADASGKTDVSSAFGHDDTKKTVNGVAVAKYPNATNEEVAAINAALMTRIEKTLAVLDVYYTENPNAAAISAGNFGTAITNAEAAIEKYDAVKAYGEELKLKLNATSGAKMYDNAEIDEAVADAQTDIYENYNDSTAWDSNEDYFADLTDISSAVEKAISEASAKFSSTKKADAMYKANYYDTDSDVQAEVGLLLAKAQDDLDAAKSVEEVAAIMAALDAALAEVRTAEAEKAVEKAIADGNYETYFANYADAQQALKGTTDYRSASFDEAEAAAVELLNEAKTVAEVATLFEQAKALFNDIKTDAELDAAGAAVAAQIAALPTTATLAERDVLLAAKAALEDFDDLYGAVNADVYNRALLTSKLGTLKSAEQKSINDAIAKLPATITLANADAVKAIRAELEKYLAEYEVESYYYDGTGDFAITGYNTLTAAESTIAGLEANVVAKQIYDLPVVVTAADKAAVEAARAAFDALPKAQQANLANAGYVAKLVKAENALAVALEAVAFTDVDAKAYLQDLSLKARSVKTAKGNVKVTVVADVDVLVENGYAVEYKFYRSEKSNKGFKVKKTTEATSYTNTSGEKGTKYFYKVVVVAKNAEGEVVAKTPLKHCLYASRTWSK